jgi:hypothetical protein
MATPFLRSPVLIIGGGLRGKARRAWRHGSVIDFRPADCNAAQRSTPDVAAHWRLAAVAA